MWTSQKLAEYDLVEIKTDEVFVVDLMYAKPENVMGVSVYELSGQGGQCVVHKDVVVNLEKLRPVLKKAGLKLKVCDAYRHPKSHEMCKELIPLDGFFAKNPAVSQHCRACAIDVVLLDEKGQELEFPCAVDAYEPRFVEQLKNGKADDFFEHLKKANYDYVGKGTKNRDKLRQMMEDAGFLALQHEWWHFNMEPRFATEECPQKYHLVELPI